MYNTDEIQNDTNRNNNSNNEGLDPNYAQENNNNFQEDQNQDQFQQSFPIEQNNQSPDNNSFHLDKKIDDFSRGEKFEQKEKELSEKLDKILGGQSSISVSTFVKNIFMINKILFLTTLAEFLFQRFDAVTLFISIVIIFIELEIFTKKHLYIWLIVLICSVLLDAFVLIDISPAGEAYLESGAGSTMLKFGLLLVLCNLCLKILIGIGLWKMAMEYKNSDEPLKVSDKYNEEIIGEGDPDILRGQRPMGGNDQFGNNENENEEN